MKRSNEKWKIHGIFFKNQHERSNETFPKGAKRCFFDGKWIFWGIFFFDQNFEPVIIIFSN